MDSGLEKRLDSALNPRWVERDDELAALCRQWRDQAWVALDTEFQRTDTFYPKPGLIQVADEQACYLIDPLMVSDLAPLRALFEDPSVLKLLHACSEDLELFEHVLGTQPRPLFDTQVAAAMLGQGLSVGYQRLVSDLLGVEVAKEETRSDWLQRPLTDAQKTYAALDVVYLPSVFQIQYTQLKEQGKDAWVLEEGERQVESARDRDPEGVTYYQRFSQSWKLRPEERAVLQSLAAWRERQARLRDMPRNHLLRNASILDLVKKKPRSLRELTGIEQLRGRTISKDGRELLQLIADALQTPRDACPAPIPRPLSTAASKRMKRLRERVRSRADALQVTPELLARKKDLEELVREAERGEVKQLPEGLRGWRQAAIGEELLGALNGQPSAAD